MSKVIDNAFVEVPKTLWTFLDKDNIEVQNAHIFWTNFAGKENQFGNRTRNFNVAVPEAAVAEMERLGYRVRKEVAGAPEDGNYVYFVNVKVNMESTYPPEVVLFSEWKGKRTRRPLDINSIGELDRIDIKLCDLRIHCYNSPKFPGKCTGYLNTMYVVQEPNVMFDGKYDDWDDPELTPEDYLEDDGKY